MNKKGQVIEDGFFMIIFLLFLGIGALVSFVVMDKVVETSQNVTQLNTTQVQAAIQSGQTVNDMWDYIILSVMVAFALGVLILGYFLDVSSVFAPIYILIMLIGVVVAAVMSYVWEQVSVAPVWVSYVSTKLPITDHILSHLAVYYTLVAGMAMVALYAKGGDR